MNLHEIYNTLFIGKKLRLSFSSKKEAETFRTALHRYKRDQELALAAADLLNAEDLKSLSFKYSPEGEAVTAVIAFSSPKAEKTYTILAVEEPDAPV
jgi:hypothetical protein